MHLWITYAELLRHQAADMPLTTQNTALRYNLGASERPLKSSYCSIELENSIPRWQSWRGHTIIRAIGTIAQSQKTAPRMGRTGPDGSEWPGRIGDAWVVWDVRSAGDLLNPRHP